MKNSLLLFLKGLAMGAANVIPGVSGGTIAFISGIYDELIASLKAFDLTAIQLLLKLNFKEFAKHINLSFLVTLFAGIGVSLVTLGKILKYLFEVYPVPVWAYFFGLILASIYFVGKTIKSWNLSSVSSLLIGTAIAISLAFMKPAAENDNFFYLTLCGVIAMASMLLPGLSGSFVLILMGNYQLIMLNAIPNKDIRIISAVAIGSVIGFVILSRIISYLLKKHESQTIGGLTGFIMGSLLIIWPWKNAIYLTNNAGEIVIRKGKQVIMGYDWLMPSLNSETMLSILLMFAGIFLVWYIERLGNKQNAS